MIDAPMLGEIPWLGATLAEHDLGQYLDLSALSQASSTL